VFNEEPEGIFLLIFKTEDREIRKYKRGGVFEVPEAYQSPAVDCLRT